MAEESNEQGNGGEGKKVIETIDGERIVALSPELTPRRVRDQRFLLRRLRGPPGGWTATARRGLAVRYGWPHLDSAGDHTSVCAGRVCGAFARLHGWPVTGQ